MLTGRAKLNEKWKAAVAEENIEGCKKSGLERSTTTTRDIAEMMDAVGEVGAAVNGTSKSDSPFDE